MIFQQLNNTCCWIKFVSAEQSIIYKLCIIWKYEQEWHNRFEMQMFFQATCFQKVVLRLNGPLLKSIDSCRPSLDVSKLNKTEINFWFIYASFSFVLRNRTKRLSSCTRKKKGFFPIRSVFFFKINLLLIQSYCVRTFLRTKLVISRHNP
jgi:hypothetical protein